MRNISKTSLVFTSTLALLVKLPGDGIEPGGHASLFYVFIIP